ncbi:YjcZ family sporulation protein [[Clostridium] spiroforme]|nr:YjcZ family sporulation protein [Thomasclavelia spiroformis]MBM6881176.1 YjcZ family sporulation protein [Thomasclavelia spiroformis]MBM6931614.1 YjcZ family sporulation protein [Thomasclavelia spiroformis]
MVIPFFDIIYIRYDIALWKGGNIMKCEGSFTLVLVLFILLVIICNML